MVAFLYLFVSMVTHAVYIVGLKCSYALLLFFWTTLFTYFGYVGVYFFRKEILEHDVYALKKLLYEFTYPDAPFYLLMACCFVVSFLVFNSLLSRYSISRITPLGEMNILFSTIGYLMLGNSFSWTILASILVILLGAFISGQKRFSFNPLNIFFTAHFVLIFGVIVQGLLESAIKIGTYIITVQTPITTKIHYWLSNIFNYLHAFPFSFYNPFYYNVGVRFFITTVFLLYITMIKKYRKKLIPVLTHHFVHIGIVSILSLISALTYFEAHSIIEDKNFLNGLIKLNIPMIILINHFYTKEPITRPEIIGSMIIVAGGCIMLFQ